MNYSAEKLALFAEYEAALHPADGSAAPTYKQVASKATNHLPRSSYFHYQKKFRGGPSTDRSVVVGTVNRPGRPPAVPIDQEEALKAAFRNAEKRKQDYRPRELSQIARLLHSSEEALMVASGGNRAALPGKYRNFRASAGFRHRLYHRGTPIYPFTGKLNSSAARTRSASVSAVKFIAAFVTLLFRAVQQLKVPAWALLNYDETAAIPKTNSSDTVLRQRPKSDSVDVKLVNAAGLGVHNCSKRKQATKGLQVAPLEHLHGAYQHQSFLPLVSSAGDLVRCAYTFKKQPNAKDRKGKSSILSNAPKVVDFIRNNAAVYTTTSSSGSFKTDNFLGFAALCAHDLRKLRIAHNAPDQVCIIVGDNCSVHSEESLRTFAVNGHAVYLKLPPQTTAFMQPLDQLFQELHKKTIAAVLFQESSTKPPHRLSHVELAECVVKSWEAICSSTCKDGINAITKAFTQCGMIPYNESTHSVDAKPAELMSAAIIYECRNALPELISWLEYYDGCPAVNFGPGDVVDPCNTSLWLPESNSPHPPEVPDTKDADVPISAEQAQIAPPAQTPAKQKAWADFTAAAQAVLRVETFEEAFANVPSYPLWMLWSTIDTQSFPGRQPRCTRVLLLKWHRVTKRRALGRVLPQWQICLLLRTILVLLPSWRSPTLAARDLWISAGLHLQVGHSVLAQSYQPINYGCVLSKVFQPAGIFH